MRSNQTGSKKSASQQGSNTRTPLRQQTGQQTKVLPMQTATEPVNVQKSRTPASVQSSAQQGMVKLQQSQVLQGFVMPQTTHAGGSFKPQSLSHQGGVMPQPQASQIMSRPQLQTQVTQERVTGFQDSPGPSGTERSLVNGEETGQNGEDEKPPLRRAGRTISWRNKTQGRTKLQENRKSLAKDLRG